MTTTAVDKGAPKQSSNPFFTRIQDTIANWIETEWHRRDALLTEAVRSGWTKQRTENEISNLTLTPERLAAALDNISLSKLRRELHKIAAPSPGQLIREARLAYAKRLLIETRLLIREVRERAGYDSESHFAESFTREVGTTPTQFRRNSIPAKQT